MIFRHGGKEIRGGLVLRLGELVAPVTAEAVAESAKHSHQVNGRASATTALVFVVRNIQTQMESILNGPVLAIIHQPGAGIEFTSRQAGDQRDGLGLVLGEFAMDEGHLRRVGKADVFGTDFAGAQDPLLGARLINLDAAGQLRSALLRGKKRVRERLEATPSPSSR